jgi:RsfA family transcription factor
VQVTIRNKGKGGQSMTAKNKKWTAEEDQILVGALEEGKSLGRTKQASYEDAAKKLARSASACRARYNSLLKYEDAPSVKQDDREDPVPGDTLDLSKGIAFLQKLQSLIPLINEQKELQEESAKLAERNKLLEKELEDKHLKLQEYLQKYEEMFGILKEAGIMAEEAGIGVKVIH